MLGIAIAAATLITLVSVHPFLTYPLSLLLLVRRRPIAPAAVGARLEPKSVAICMSAYNEELVIAAKMDSLIAMAATYPGAARIHVYADAPSDRTSEILANYTDRADIVFGAERRGKTWGMAVLVERSQSELLMFSDANVIADSDAIEGLAAAFDDPEVGLASARLTYSNPGESATSRGGAAYWEFEEWIKRIESATIGLVGVDGAMFMIRRALYRTPPPYLIDDLYVSLTTLISRARIVSIDSVKVFERSSALASEEFNRKKRIACQAWNVHKALWSELRHLPAIQLYGYISHRVLKWLTPLSVLCLILAYGALFAVLYGVWSLLAVACGAAALLGLGNLLGFQPAEMVISMAVSLAGVGVGLFQSFFTKKTYTIWQTIDSIRFSEDLANFSQKDGPTRP